MSQELSDDRILTAKEVAEWLKVSPQKIFSWAKKKQIPSFKLGRNVRFWYSEIRDWLKGL